MIYEGTTVDFWLTKIQTKTFNPEAGRRWAFKCSHCEKMTSRDTSPMYYEIKYPHGLDDQRVWKPFCTHDCANNWVQEWFSREAEERNAALKKKEKGVFELSNSQMPEASIENYMDEVLATWESNAYQTRTYVNYIFSDDIFPNDLAILVWLAGMWLHQEHAAFTVNWEECQNSIKISEEEKAESLDTLTTKGWVEQKDDGSLTLHIPRKLYWFRYGKPDHEIINKFLERVGLQHLKLRIPE